MKNLHNDLEWENLHYEVSWKVVTTEIPQMEQEQVFWSSHHDISNKKYQGDFSWQLSGDVHCGLNINLPLWCFSITSKWDPCGWGGGGALSLWVSRYRVLQTLAGAADGGLTGNFRWGPNWNNMAQPSWHAKCPNSLQIYGWVICFEINCTWKQMSHSYVCLSKLVGNLVNWWKLAQNSCFICGMQQTKTFKLYMFTYKRQTWDLSGQLTSN